MNVERGLNAVVIVCDIVLVQASDGICVPTKNANVAGTINRYVEESKRWPTVKNKPKSYRAIVSIRHRTSCMDRASAYTT